MVKPIVLSVHTHGHHDNLGENREIRIEFKSHLKRETNQYFSALQNSDSLNTQLMRMQVSSTCLMVSVIIDLVFTAKTTPCLQTDKAIDYKKETGLNR